MRKWFAAVGLAACVAIVPTASATASTPAGSVSDSTTQYYVSGQQVVQFAMRYLGYPYSLSGATPAGFSCIGFVWYVYRHLGVPYPSGGLEGGIRFGAPVPFSQLLPGDVLFFQNTVWPGLSHAAIYIGGGKFIHARWYDSGVTISSFNNDPRDGNYWIGKYLTARRPWNGPAIGAAVPGSTNGTTSSAPSSSVTKLRTGPSAQVIVSGLNVRAGPGMGYGVRTVIPKGTTVTIIVRWNRWTKIQTPSGVVGWVVNYGITRPGGSVQSSSQKVQVSKPTAPARAGAPAKSGYRAAATTKVSVSGLRVHTAPSLGAPIVTTLYQGQRVVVLKRVGAWLHVRLPNGATGWILASYTSERKAAVATAPKAVKRSTRTASLGKYVITAGVRVHARASLTSRVITLAAAGTHVHLLGRRGSWDHVRLPSGIAGFVYGSYVS